VMLIRVPSSWGTAGGDTYYTSTACGVKPGLVGQKKIFKDP
jgi:hypothetical protein